MWDLDRPLEEDSSVELLNFDDIDGKLILSFLYCNLCSGKKVFWHSSAHILGEAMERHYGGCLCYGPPIDSGYYYDMFLSDRLVNKSVLGSSSIFTSIQRVCALYYRGDYNSLTSDIFQTILLNVRPLIHYFSNAMYGCPIKLGANVAINGLCPIISENL